MWQPSPRMQQRTMPLYKVLTPVPLSPSLGLLAASHFLKADHFSLNGNQALKVAFEVYNEGDVYNNEAEVHNQ